MRVAVPARLVVLALWNPALLFAQFAVHEKWIAEYDGPANGGDYAVRGAVDAEGNVFVVGPSTGLDHDARCPDPCTPGRDYALVKYDSSGAMLWVARYNGTGGRGDNPVALEVDAEGNAFVTGLSPSRGGDNDYATVMYDASGQTVWVARYDGGGGLSDYGVALAIDCDGNVLVTGSSAGQDSGVDFATLQYDPQGNEIWVVRYDGPAHGDDEVRDLAVDGEGNVYVAGLSERSDGRKEIVILKYDRDGNQASADRYDELGGVASVGDMMLHGTLYGCGDRISPSTRPNNGGPPTGFLYLTGTTDGAVPEAYTLKLRTDRGVLWTARFDGRIHRGSRGKALAVDADGNVVVGGSSILSGGERGSPLNPGYAVVKYASDGAFTWAAYYDGPTSKADSPFGGDSLWDLVVDSDGRVYVSGSSFGRETNTDIATVVYDSSGKTLLVSRYDGRNSSQDYVRDVFQDSLGNVYVTGTASQSPRNTDFITIKYSTVRDLHFLRGDCDRDSRIAISDPIKILTYNFLGGDKPKCLAACDADGNGAVVGSVEDAVYLLNFSFLGGPRPVPPFPECGSGALPTDVELGCAESGCSR